MDKSNAGKCVAIIGTQWGDEGKGKLCDFLCQEMDVCVKFNGGSNAGHTVIANGKRYAFHLLPSGAVNEKCLNIIGNGVVIHLQSLVKEMEQFNRPIKLAISDRAHIVCGFHLVIDAHNEDGSMQTSLGTTKKGIGPCYADKASRIGLRMGDLLKPGFADKYRTLYALKLRQFPYLADKYDVEKDLGEIMSIISKITPYITDGSYLLNKSLDKGSNVLLEGSNASMLDIDYGTYPFVTSSHPTIGGAVVGAGIAPRRLTDVFGIIKAYTTRVGQGYFPTELNDDIGKRMQVVGKEVGTTTGRVRRCGWLDLVVISYTNMLNGYTQLNLTKVDVLTGIPLLKVGVAYSMGNGSVLGFGRYPSDIEDLEKVTVHYVELPGWTEDISGCKLFEELPANCQDYIKFIEKWTGLPIKWIGVGPDREQLIIK